ncbi:MAG: PAS domain S-box protein, partial [Bacteroidales bacterium]|nr:PAS domain S-box protein [Bacteroidales bacterium]
MNKILAIDDQRDNLITIKAVIKSYISDCEVLTTLSGKEGIELARVEQPDTILLDIIMPQMDGYEVCRKLKADTFTKHIPVVMITAIKTDAESRIKALNIGADAFLSKPIDPSELIAHLNVMFRIKKAEDKLRAEKQVLEELVTERTHELKESENKLRNIFENSTNLFYSHTTDHVITYLSPQVEQILGYTPEEAMVKWTELVTDHPINHIGFSHTVKAIKTGKSQASYELELLRKDGTKIWVEVREAPVVENGKTVSIVGSITDISERKQSEITLQHSEYLLRESQKMAGLGSYILDIASGFWESSSVLLTIFGIDSKYNRNIDGWLQLIHPDDKQMMADHFTIHVLKNHEPFNKEYRIIRKNDQNVRWVHGLGKLEFSNDGNPIRMIGTIQDITERKKSEESITKLSTAVKQSPSVIAIADLQGKLEYVNPKFTELTGYTQKEVLGQYSNILKSGEQSSDFYKELWETIRSGKLWRGEFHNKKKNGELFWEAASISPIIDSEGNIINFIKVAEDITERKKVENALKASEEKHKRLIETASEGFWLIDTQNITINVNQSLCDMLGYSKNEMLGKTPFDFVDEENFNIFSEQLSKASANRQRTYEVTLNSRTGSRIPTLINATSIKDEKGEFAGSFAFVTNVSLLKRGERVQKVLYNISNAVITTHNIKELIDFIHEELGSIIDTTNFYIALYDKKDNTFSLPFFSDQKDKLSSMPLGKTLTNYVIKSKKSLLANKETKLILEQNGEIERYGTDSEIWLGVPLWVEGEVKGVLAVQSYTDENAFGEDDKKMLEFVSDQIGISIYRKKAEEDLMVALQKAEESDRLKSAFLATMSHELRTPLNAVIGFSEIINEDDVELEDIKDYNRSINSSGKHLLSIVEDIFDFSLIESGQVHIEKRVINLHLFLKDIHELIRAEQIKVEKHELKIYLDVALDDNPMFISADPSKLMQILINLLQNALKFTEKGTIHFGYRIEEVERVKMLNFYIHDTGIGISAEKQKIIFDVFRQVEDSNSRRHGGVGLGLSITRKLVELMGGEIGVYSELEKGSMFNFTIPLEKIEAETSQLTLKDDLSLDGKTILIVEDDMHSYELLKIPLKSRRASILWATDGEQAIQLCEKNTHIDLVLMDMNLPVVNGYKASRAIRKLRPQLPIIAQTAYAQQDNADSIIEAGCNDIISKPLQQKKLL